MQQSNYTEPNALVRFYNDFISVLRYCVAHIRKHLVLFIACIVVTTAIIYIKLNGGKKYFDISFTVSYEELARKIYGDRINKINTLLNLREYDKLKVYFNVSEPTIKGLLSVKGKNILGEDLTEDMNLEKVPFVITMRVKDTNAIIQLQNGIVNYLETGTPYLVSRKAIKMEEVDEELAFIDNQLVMMDSLKRRYNNESVSNSDMIANADDKSPSATGSIYSFSYTLYKRKQELLRKKAMPNNLQIIDDAVVPEEGKKPFLLIALVGIIGGSIIYAGISGILIPVFRRER
ncbi:MAG: hypothetical protein EOP51_00560 [Sphingobacteriales bacterium]|nr:MAG: hypothetical protein EOP51_00560 [Sphingobacteriales bacterium]